MTQEEFDEKNRQFRMNKALAQSDGVNVWHRDTAKSVFLLRVMALGIMFLISFVRVFSIHIFVRPWLVIAWLICWLAAWVTGLPVLAGWAVWAGAAWAGSGCGWLGGCWAAWGGEPLRLQHKLIKINKVFINWCWRYYICSKNNIVSCRFLTTKQMRVDEHAPTGLKSKTLYIKNKTCDITKYWSCLKFKTRCIKIKTSLYAHRLHITT